MIIVAGITRSGLSLTMQMLHAGGFPCVGEPPAFEEYGIGQIPWKDCHDRAVKLVDAQLQFPPQMPCKVIRLRRNLKQQAKSFNKFNKCFGLPSAPISKLIKSFRRDYYKIDTWAKKQSGLMTIEFETIIKYPGYIAMRISKFSGRDLNIGAMASCVVDRSPDCYPTMLELDLLEP